ncbi:MAG: MATE family efflux transporter [Rhodoferax sp.]|nr:MATE family efflux transporter [Rhodoferax sp.]
MSSAGPSRAANAPPGGSDVHAVTSVGAEILSLWRLAWPILVGQLASVGLSATAVMMAGNASAQDLAGVSLGASIWLISNVTLIGLMLSVNPVIAHHVGAGALDRVPQVVRQGLWKALAVGLVAAGLNWAVIPVFDRLALQPAVQELAADFVRISSAGLPAFAAYRVLYGYSASLNQTRPMMVVALAALGLHVALSALLVHGLGGLPRLGGLGCAWAVLASTWFSLAALLVWIARAPAYRATWPFARFEWPDGPVLAMLLRLGLPIGVTYFAETSAFGLIALLLARFGAVEVGAHQIALNAASVTFMLPMSVGLAMLTRIGHSLGAGRPAEARFRAWVGIGMALTLSATAALGMALGSRQIAGLYTHDAAVTTLAARLLLLAAVFQLSDGLQVAASSALRGYKVTRAPMVIHLASFWGLSLPLGCALGLAPVWLPLAPDQPMGAPGFWIGLVVALTFAALSLTALLRRVARSRLPRPASTHSS